MNGKQMSVIEQVNTIQICIKLSHIAYVILCTIIINVEH